MAITSRLKLVNLDMLTLLRELKNSGNISLFTYINIWNDQIDDLITGDAYAFGTPACFVEIIPNEPMALSRGFTSYPEFTIRLHFCNQILDGLNNTMEQNLQIFDIREQLVAKFNRSGKIRFCSTLMLNQDTMDYNHGSIYKYILGFKCNFIDSKGSEFDPDSGYTWGYLTNPTLNLNLFYEWVTGKAYKVNALVVYRCEIYLCTVANSDILFNPANWLKVRSWTPKAYAVNDYTIFQSVLYQCITENNDAVFNPVNWNQLNLVF